MTAVALLWLSVCVLARSDRAREICLVGSIVLLLTLTVMYAR